MGVMRPDRSGRLAPADVVDLLDEISALLREQGGNQALELSLRDLSMSLQAIQDQLSRAQQTSTPTDPTSLVAPLVDRITDALGALANLPAPQVALPDRMTADLSPKAVELLQGLAPKQDGDVLAKLVEKLDALDFRMKGGKAFGSSGPSNIADNPSRELGRVTTVDGDKVSTETTLAAVLAKLTSIDDALNNTDNSVQAAVASVAASTWTSVVSHTPASPITVVGFNADPDAILSFDFRYRLRVSGAVKVSEVIAANQLSYIQVAVDVAAGSTVDVQVFHAQAAPQDFQASIAYRE